MLAAGLSSRSSDWKMLLRCGEVTMVEASVAAASAACARVIVVAGHRAGELIRLFRGRPGVQVEVNPRFEQGMLSSVACGAAAVRTPRFFLALADMPLVSPETYRLLLEAPPADAVIPKFHGKKGHPLLLTAAVAGAVVTAAGAVVTAAGAAVNAAGVVVAAAGTVAAASPGQTLRDVLAGFSTLLLPVADPHVLHDVDTDRDYSELLGGNR
jgi:molybdenum cofactor cytidylyltransferase